MELKDILLGQTNQTQTGSFCTVSLGCGGCRADLAAMESRTLVTKALEGHGGGRDGERGWVKGCSRTREITWNILLHTRTVVLDKDSLSILKQLEKIWNAPSVKK